MPLIVENGTGVEGANTFVTIAEVDNFFADRNELDWAGASASSAQKQGFILNAADDLRLFQWFGNPISAAQGMPLPTTVLPTVPPAVKTAQILLAKEAAQGRRLGSTLGSKTVSSERKKLEGVGETEITYDDGPGDLFNQNSLIYGLVFPFIRRPNSGIQSVTMVYS